jgi:hypothetical protein
MECHRQNIWRVATHLEISKHRCRVAFSLARCGSRWGLWDACEAATSRATLPVRKPTTIGRGEEAQIARAVMDEGHITKDLVEAIVDGSTCNAFCKESWDIKCLLPVVLFCAHSYIHRGLLCRHGRRCEAYDCFAKTSP